MPRPGAVPEFSGDVVAQAGAAPFLARRACGPTTLAHCDEVTTHLAALCQLLARDKGSDSLALPPLYGLPKPTRWRPPSNS